MGNDLEVMTFLQMSLTPLGWKVQIISSKYDSQLHNKIFPLSMRYLESGAVASIGETKKWPSTSGQHYSVRPGAREIS